MKKSELYLRAAERQYLYSGGSCVSIYHCDTDKKNKYLASSKAVRDYQKLFSPDIKADGDWGDAWGYAWGTKWGRNGYVYSPILVKKCRVLALCFAAAMAETGDL